MEKLLRVKASKFKGEQWNYSILEEEIMRNYSNVACVGFRVSINHTDINFTLLVDNDVDIDYAEKVVADRLNDLLDDNGYVEHETLVTVISDMEEVLLSE